MMEKANNNIASMTDKALLALIGNFIKETRLRKNKTQQQVASEAGIYRTTLVQIEKGAGGNMQSFVQIMRAIEQLQLFSFFEVSQQLSPLQLAKLNIKKRQRAIGTKSENAKPKSDW
jgi:transcriptional regulator with XRE-family HTH domain